MSRREQPRTPPHSPDAEAALLGAMLLDPRAVETARAIIARPNWFHNTTNAAAYAAILAVTDRGERADPVTVADHLTRDGATPPGDGWAALLTACEDGAIPSNAAGYARIVAERACHRALITTGNEIAEIGWAGPHEIDVDAHIARLRSITDRLEAIARADRRIRDDARRRAA